MAGTCTGGPTASGTRLSFQTSPFKSPEIDHICQQMPRPASFELEVFASHCDCRASAMPSGKTAHSFLFYTKAETSPPWQYFCHSHLTHVSSLRSFASPSFVAALTLRMLFSSPRRLDGLNRRSDWVGLQAALPIVMDFVFSIATGEGRDRGQPGNRERAPDGPADGSCTDASPTGLQLSHCNCRG